MKPTRSLRRWWRARSPDIADALGLIAVALVFLAIAQAG